MSLSRRVDQARDAFKHGDEEGSAAAHEAGRIIQEAEERHGEPSHQYIGDVVYGALDGIITTFAVVSGVAGAELGTQIVLILGLANLFADGFSMATGAYLSSKSEQEYYEKEWQREAWEVDKFPEGERLELQSIYQEQGYSEEEARQLVGIISSDKERWVKAMMVDELGLMADERKPILSALTTLVSFVVAGSVPLIIYLLGLLVPIQPGITFPISLALSALALFGLGAAKVWITRLNVFRSGLEMLLVGGVAAGVAYAVGALLKGVGA